MKFLLKKKLFILSVFFLSASFLSGCDLLGVKKVDENFNTTSENNVEEPLESVTDFVTTTTSTTESTENVEEIVIEKEEQKIEEVKSEKISQKPVEKVEPEKPIEKVPVEKPVEKPTPEPTPIPTPEPKQVETPEPSINYDSYRQQCADKINAWRATEGKPALARWTSGESCADESSQKEYESGSPHSSFGSCGELAQNLCPGYDSFGSIFSYCMVQMWDEGPGEPYSAHGHYLNMSNADYSKVACGFYEAPDGKIWHVENFK